MIRSRLITNPSEWTNALQQLPLQHLLQSWEWGEFKSKYGWTAQRILWENERTPVAAAQVLTRTVRLPLLPLKPSISYCPKGPLLDWNDEELRALVLADLKSQAHDQGVIFVKIDPNLRLSSPEPGQTTALPGFLETQGWRASREQIQFRNTLLIDLAPTEEELLAAMKQKTRYNIRLADRKGVSIRTGGQNDLDLLYSMYAETALRDNFAIRSREYYHDAWEAFIQAGLAQPFIAEVDGEPVAAAILFHYAGTALYMYGMSRSAHRKLMPTYLIQWEMIQWAKENQCHTYDFWGAPDNLNESDPMWGVYRFKIGFNPQMLYTPGALDYPVRRILYALYTQILPGILSIWRKIGRRQTSRELNTSNNT